MTYGLNVQNTLHRVQKNAANFETVWLEIIRIDFDDNWLKCSKYSTSCLGITLTNLNTVSQIFGTNYPDTSLY